MNTYEFSNDEFEQIIEFMENKGKIILRVVDTIMLIL